MKNDPFVLLQVDAGAGAGELARAFSNARARGVPTNQARHAFDSLRDPVTREAMALLAISLSPGYQDLMAVGDEDAGVQAAELVVGAISAALGDLEAHLRSDDVLPRENLQRDVRDYVPAPMEVLEP